MGKGRGGVGEGLRKGWGRVGKGWGRVREGAREGLERGWGRVGEGLAFYSSKTPFEKSQ